MTSSFSLLSAVLFATLAAIATCAPAISVASPTNNTPTLYQCTDSEKWTAPIFLRGDCYMALASGAFVDELNYFDDELVEFYTDGGGPLSLPESHPQQAVPRKYTFGRCTMTIAMMLDFKMGDIPGFDPSKAFPYHDVTYYREIAIVARFLLNHCIDIGQMGWFAVGRREAIGVFWWETGSEIDESIHAVNAVTNTSATLLPSLGFNGTE